MFVAALIGFIVGALAGFLTGYLVRRRHPTDPKVGPVQL